MAHVLLCLGSIQKLMRNKYNCGSYSSLQRCNKSNSIRVTCKGNFVEIREAKIKKRIKEDDKEQHNVYKQLVHDFKPITYINKDKPQKDMLQILNKKVKETRDLGTTPREIYPKAKKAVYFIDNKNINTFPKKHCRSDMMYLVALANLVHDGNQPYDSENESIRNKDIFCKRNKNLHIQTTVDVLEPQNDLYEMLEGQNQPPLNASNTLNSKTRNKLSDIYRIYGVTLDHASRNICVPGKKENPFCVDFDKKERLSRIIVEKYLNKNVLINTQAVYGCKQQIKTENYEDPLIMSTFSTYDCDKEGVSLYEDTSKICKKDSLIKSKTETFQCSASDTREQEYSANEDTCLIKCLPPDALHKEEVLVNPKIETRQYSVSNTGEEQFSLYEDACQIESSPTAARDKPCKQSLRLKETASLMEMVQNARERSRAEYFKTCFRSLAVTVANKPTCLPPLGPPPIMFPPTPSMPPLPSCPKRETKKKNKK